MIRSTRYSYTYNIYEVFRSGLFSSTYCQPVVVFVFSIFALALARALRAPCRSVLVVMWGFRAFNFRQCLRGNSNSAVVVVATLQRSSPCLQQQNVTQAPPPQDYTVRSMVACNASLFRSALVAILVHAVGGNEFRDGLGAAVSPPRSQAFEPAQGSRLASSRVAADRFEAVSEVDTGPDPFFADLEVIVPQQDDHDADLSHVSQKTRTFSVEVFEVQSRGLGRKWREATTGWTYKVQTGVGCVTLCSL